MDCSARCLIGSTHGTLVAGESGNLHLNIEHGPVQLPLGLGVSTEPLNLSVAALVQPKQSSGDILWLLQNASALLDALHDAETSNLVIFPRSSNCFCFNTSGAAQLLPSHHVSTSAPATTPGLPDNVAKAILSGDAIAAPEILESIHMDRDAVDTSLQLAWVAGVFLRQLSSSDLSLNAAPHEQDAKLCIPRSRLAGAFSQICKSLCSEDPARRLSLSGAMEALARVGRASGLLPLTPESSATVLFTKASDTGALDVQLVRVPLPAAGVQAPLADVCAAVQAALAAEGVQMDTVHLSVPSWGLSLPSQLAYSFAPHATVPVTLGHCGLGAVASSSGGTELHCALLATAQPAPLPPALQLLGAATAYQPVHPSHTTANDEITPAAPPAVAAVAGASGDVVGLGSREQSPGDAEGAASAEPEEPASAQAQLVDAATPVESVPAPEMTFPVLGFSSTDRNPHSTVEGNFASSIKWGSVMCVLKDSAGLSAGKHSWAFRVSKKGSRGGMCIGVASAEFNASTKNLGPALHSWGYSSSGKRSAGYPEFLDYAESFGQDDVVGVHLDCDAGTLAFSKNGRYLGVAFTDLQGKSVFPAVCMGGRSSTSKRKQLPHELEALTTEEQYVQAVRASQLQAPADKPSFHFAWQLPVAADDAQHAAHIEACEPSVSGGGWDLALPCAVETDLDPCTAPASLALLQHPAMGIMSDSNPTGRYEFGFDCLDIPAGAVLWFVLASSSALDGCTQPTAGLYSLAAGVCQSGVWAVSSEGHVVQDGVLSEQRMQWPAGLDFAAVRNVGLVFGLPAVDPATVKMTKSVPDTDLPVMSIVLDYKHVIVPPDFARDLLWECTLTSGGVRVGVAAACFTAGRAGSALLLRSNEIARMISFDRGNTHITVGMGGSTAQCSAQWASAPLVHSGMTRGKHVWSFKVQERGSVGGICIGVACADFEFRNKNVGAYQGSWGWSSSGTKGYGEGSFVAYGESYGTGDVIGVELDCEEGTLRFHKNGVDQGVAFATGLKGLTLVPAVCLGGVRSSKSSKPSSSHSLQLHQSHCGVQQLQASADAAIDAGSAVPIGNTSPEYVRAEPTSVELAFPEEAPSQHTGVTIAAGPGVVLTAGNLSGKASWRFRVDALQCNAAAGAATLRESLQHALPSDGENMQQALEQLVQDWSWAQHRTAHAAGMSAHYAKAAAPNALPSPLVPEATPAGPKTVSGSSDAPLTTPLSTSTADAGPSAKPDAEASAAAVDAESTAKPDAEASAATAPAEQLAQVHMGVTFGIATDTFMEGLAASPVGVGCDAAGMSLGLTSSGLLARSGKCAWLSKSRSILRPFQFLQEGDVITLSVTPKEPPAAAAGGAAAGVSAVQTNSADLRDSSTIIRLKDMQPLSGMVSSSLGDGGATQFFGIQQLSPGPSSGPVKLQDAALTTSGSPGPDLQMVQLVEHTDSEQLTTEVSATGDTEPRDAAAATMEYTLSLSLNGQELCSPVPSALLPRVLDGQSVLPVVTLGGGMRRVRLTLLTNAAEADAAVAASQCPIRVPRPSCSFVPEQQLSLPLSSTSQDAMAVVFSRHWATVPIITGVPLTQQPATAAGAWRPSHGLPLNSGVHAFHAMIKAKAEGGAIVLGFVSAAPHSPFKWGQWHLGANSGSFGVSSAGDIGGGMQRSKGSSEQWRCFGTDDEGKRNGATPAPLFKAGSVVTWFVDTDVSEAQPHARVGLRVDANFLGMAFAIPASAFPIVPAVCGGGANGVSRHAVQLLPAPGALDRSQASKRAVLGGEERLITCTTSWASAFVQHPGMRSGKHSVYWKLLSQAPAGAVCVGVADVQKFQVTARNVGADSHSWGYSSSGKLSAAKSGEFLDYGVAYKMGDVVGVHLDADAGQLNFTVNGAPQGPALGSVLKSIEELVPALCVGSSRSGTPHTVKLLPLLTQEQVAYTLARGWRDAWTAAFKEPSLDKPTMDGTPVLVNMPELQAAAPAAAGAGAGAGAAGAADAKDKAPA